MKGRDQTLLEYVRSKKIQGADVGHIKQVLGYSDLDLERAVKDLKGKIAFSEDRNKLFRVGRNEDQ